MGGLIITEPYKNHLVRALQIFSNQDVFINLTGCVVLQSVITF